MRPALTAISRYPFLRAWVIGGLGLAATTLIGLLGVAGTHPPPGLEVTLFDSPASDARSVFVGHDASLDPEAIARANGLHPDRPFAVEWRGQLIAIEPGIHHLRVRADDGIAIWVDDVAVMDQLTHRGELNLSAPVELSPGLHTIRIRYEQIGGDAVLRIWCATPLWREEARPLRGRVVPPGTTFSRVVVAERLPVLLATAWSVWILLGVLLGCAAMLASAAGVGRISRLLGWSEILPLALIALPLLAFSLWLGTAPWRSWVPDEVVPSQVLDGWEQRFAGGWSDMYPPLPFYLFMIVNAPSVLAMPAALVESDAAFQTLTHLVSRGSSLGFAFLTLLAVSMLTDRTIGGRARVFAPYVVLGLPLFAFYSKTYNPESAYIFWVTAGAVAFVRAAGTGSIAAHAWLGVFAAAAVATKDQAYGFWIAPAAVLLWCAWQRAQGGLSARLFAVVRDRGLWAGLSASVLAYSILSGVWWNLGGLRTHFALITGQGSAPYRVFPATLSGLEGLAATSIALAAQAMGPIAVVLTLVGLAVLVASGTAARRFWIVMAIPLGYWLSFVGVVGYVYDRYLILIVMMLAMAAGAGWAWIDERIPSGRRFTAVRAALLLFVLTPTLVLNARMAGDSRRDAERWMRETLTSDPLVLGTGSPLYLPNLYPFQHRVEQRRTAEHLLAWDADVIVLDEDWFGRFRQETVDRVRRTLEAAGYAEQFVVRERASNRWLTFFCSGLSIDPGLSNVSKIDPALAIWVRERRDATPGDN